MAVKAGVLCQECDVAVVGILEEGADVLGEEIDVLYFADRGAGPQVMVVTHDAVAAAGGGGGTLSSTAS